MPDGVLGHGYILPYKKTAVFIPGYKGLLDLARRSGEISWVQAHVVYENDEFHYTYGADPTITHVPARIKGEEPGPMTAAYGIAKFKSGEVQFEVMHKDEIEAIRKRSRAANDGPWVTDYDEMARKTVIRRLCKFLPMNPEYQLMVARDEYAEAGVLGKYIDVDPETGEVIDQPQAPSTGDMLDMFADQMEEEKEHEPEIPDPRFETGDEPESAGDSEVDREAAEEAAQAEEPEFDTDGEGSDPQVAGDGDGDAEAGGDQAEEEEPLLDQGQGRISKQEDASFAAAVENLRERMRKIQTDELIERVFNNRLAMFGAKRYLDIRQRLDREKFYRELVQMCEQWESMPKTDDD
jgi:recombination protein RecT